MEICILDNKIKLLYEYKKGNITSFCIGFDAGALREEEYNFGVAHALEHILFKGTKKRTEKEINLLTDKLFGFSNAMTNFPYAIYYGTSSSLDFKKAFELYSDILMNAAFLEEGFKEEMNVILQECREWKEDFSQYCEDELFLNTFKNRRIRDIIIGNEKSIENITLEELKKFYNEFYRAENCVVSVVTSLSIEEIIEVLNATLGKWEKGLSQDKNNNMSYEFSKVGVFLREVTGLEGAKLQYCFDISTLTEEEIEALNIFNMIFGEGVSSILYDNIRTKEGLAYEVYSEIKNEKGIKLFSINVSTSKDSINRVLEIIDTSLNNVETYIEDMNVKDSIKRLKLKRELSVEKSIELAKKLTTYEIMYADSKRLFREIYDEKNISKEMIINTVRKVFKNKAVQILK